MSKIESKIEEISDQVAEISQVVHKIDKEVALHKSSFDEHIRQDERMYEEFKRMNDILQTNTESLKEHMHRTEVAEKQLGILEDLAKNIDLRLSPIEKERIENEAIEKYRNEKLIKIGKILGFITALVGIIAGIKSF